MTAPTASPSRQTRIRRKPGSAVSAGSQVPSSLSGIQTTWLTPHSFSAVTTEFVPELHLMICLKAIDTFRVISTRTFTTTASSA